MIDSRTQFMAPATQMTTATPATTAEPLAPRDPNAPAGPRPTFEVTPMEKLREATPAEAATATRGPETVKEPDAAVPAQTADATPSAVSATPTSPNKGAELDIRA